MITQKQKIKKVITIGIEMIAIGIIAIGSIGFIFVSLIHSGVNTTIGASLISLWLLEMMYIILRQRRLYMKSKNWSGTHSIGVILLNILFACLLAYVLYIFYNQIPLLFSEEQINTFIRVIFYVCIAIIFFIQIRNNRKKNK